jgi:ketosteroid isomerase-like protein
MGGNADIVKSAWEAFSQQDLDKATADVDPSADIVVPESLPWGGTYRGPDGFKDMVGQFMGHLEDFRPSPRGFLEAEDEHVVVPLDVQGRTKAGKDFSGGALWLYQLRGGKIVRAQLYADTASTLQALG